MCDTDAGKEDGMGAETIVRDLVVLVCHARQAHVGSLIDRAGREDWRLGRDGKGGRLLRYTKARTVWGIY
jgi:hypothetical protein